MVPRLLCGLLLHVHGASSFLRSHRRVFSAPSSPATAIFSTTIDRPTTTPKLKGADPKNKENTGGGKGKHELLLFDDPVNTREYVSRVLCTKVALTEGEAYDCMMTAHQSGLAVVGVYQFEVAENYCTQMKESGLVAAVKPVGDGNGGE